MKIQKLYITKKDNSVTQPLTEPSKLIVRAELKSVTDAFYDSKAITNIR